jgi:hypothetical protein
MKSDSNKQQQRAHGAFNVIAATIKVRLSSYAGSTGEVQAQDPTICSQRRGRSYDCMVLYWDSQGAAAECDHVCFYVVYTCCFLIL